MLRKNSNCPIYMWHPTCYSCYKPGNFGRPELSGGRTIQPDTPVISHEGKTNPDIAAKQFSNM